MVTPQVWQGNEHTQGPRFQLHRPVPSSSPGCLGSPPSRPPSSPNITVPLICGVKHLVRGWGCPLAPESLGLGSEFRELNPALPPSLREGARGGGGAGLSCCLFMALSCLSGACLNAAHLPLLPETPPRFSGARVMSRASKDRLTMTNAERYKVAFSWLYR